ncbi:DNA-3-methyladenine glycosylase 2 [Vagococcus silagei]|uniref:DNA-3-methyladenine glycosylase II n=1 Tax=Vagococcus silagei TaxID=2508885 RepID=A0A4S3B3W0_9ENTE|nr:DNA-3-methyladenine glycosylase [Vagococcus silagei]THB61138.1 DNA-3-methyladenine glycosylase 2 family protein [Vagococcus silagei]
MKIIVTQPFKWEPILDYLNRDALEPMYQVIDGRVRRAFEVDGKIIICEITYDELDKCLCVTFLNHQKVSPIGEQEIADYISEWLDLDYHLEAFYQFAETDELLAELIPQFYGLRLVGVPDFYEALVWGILGQQINLSFAYTLKKRFVEKYGKKIEYQDEVYWIHPKAEDVAKTTQEDLLSLRLTQRKAEYLLDVSRRVASGEMSKSYYLNCDSAKEAEKDLIKIRGIGPWTANYVLMRCLRMGEAFPMKDIGLLNGIKTIRGLDEKPTSGDLLALKDQFGEWCSYATFYIWRVLY